MQSSYSTQILFGSSWKSINDAIWLTEMIIINLQHMETNAIKKRKEKIVKLLFTLVPWWSSTILSSRLALGYWNKLVILVEKPFDTKIRLYNRPNYIVELMHLRMRFGALLKNDLLWMYEFAGYVWCCFGLQIHRNDNWKISLRFALNRTVIIKFTVAKKINKKIEEKYPNQWWELSCPKWFCSSFVDILLSGGYGG